MNVVVIYPQHNATVALFVNGVCEWILHEEKFSNIKNHTGFPYKALDFLSKISDFKNIDAFLFPSEELFDLCVPEQQGSDKAQPGKSHNPWETASQGRLRNVYNWLEYHLAWKNCFFHLRDVILHKIVTPRSKAKTLAFLNGTYGINEQRVIFSNHHLCHCLSPFLFYDLGQYKRDFLLFSMDGAGDNLFAKILVYHHQTHSFTPLSESRYDASIGLLYCETTRFLGMKPTEHEYKVMGLAAYPTHFEDYQPLYKKLKEIFHLCPDTLTFTSKFNTNLSCYYLQKHARGFRFDFIAAALQKVTEDLVTEWVQAAIKKTGIRDVAFGGGVFLNVKMNQKIQELSHVNKAFFLPSCGDESNVMGAACNFYWKKSSPFQAVETMSLGLRYSHQEVEHFLGKNAGSGVNVNHFDDIDGEVARLLSEFNIVARFQGPGEWGARSLCHRAILGNASDLKTFYEVNDAIKMRDFWMPFAPTILEEWAERYILNWNNLKSKVFESSQYMITAFDSTPLAQQHLRAAIHQKDKTLRPQVVYRSKNTRLHSLLKHYEALSGMGGVMNTSFNLHGYPLVGTLDQAWFTFTKSGLKFLALENFLISKVVSHS
jgi:carbamoyltransferase